MYFSASDRLAENDPSLRRVIEACDQLILAMGSTGSLTLAAIAQRLSMDTYQVEQVLNALTNSGVLQKEQSLVCDECGTSNARRRATCTQCGEGLGGATSEAVYSRTMEPDSMVNEPEVAKEKMLGPDGKPLATVGIITALPAEYAALCSVLALKRENEWVASGAGAGRRYRFGAVRGSNGMPHIVAATMLADTGNNSAAARTTQFLQHFPGLPHVVMCGIAGSLDQDVARLGDVVVCDQFGVVQYDFGKDRDGEFELTSRPRAPSAQLIEAMRYLEAARLEGHRPWEALLAQAARPCDNAGAKPGQTLVYEPDPERVAGMPKVMSGKIASANTLLRNQDKRDRLRSELDLLAVEMEGSGVADAAWLDGTAGYLVIRGIVDYADGNKGDVWHGYASHSAAAVLRALLESMPG